MPDSEGSLYLGWDLSTQQLKGIAVSSDLEKEFEANVHFDDDFGAKYGIKKGVLRNDSDGEIFTPVPMWLDAIDLVLQRLFDQGLEFSRVKGISGAGMQHGTVFWSSDAATRLENLRGDLNLAEQLASTSNGQHEGSAQGFGAFSHPYSPNWQDSSTREQCKKFEMCLGDPHSLAMNTGSSAHTRFSGPQIMRFREKYPERYLETSRISLVSSFLASIFLGKIAPIDISDVTGMNLWDVKTGDWNGQLLTLAAGGQENVSALREKLGPVPEQYGKSLGRISPYFVQRYGFDAQACIVQHTGDNPATILALPLQPTDAIISLGTSTTFLMATSEYKPDPAYHFMNHPTSKGLYMFMLCYKNGALARERVRDAINSMANSHTAMKTTSKAAEWDAFNAAATGSKPLRQKSAQDSMHLALYFPLPEIVPNVDSGEWHYSWSPYAGQLRFLSHDKKSTSTVPEDARTILESQLLSLRLRSRNLVHEHGDLPPQPRRIYLVGGGSVNPVIAQLVGEVLGGAEGVFRLDVGGNACALGSAYQAVWAIERKSQETFESFVDARWDESSFVKKVDQGYRSGIFERYGVAIEGFKRMEEEVIKEGVKVGSQ